MRSFLFVPADSEKKIAKGVGSDADCLILDLEDSLAPERRPEGRRLALEFLRGSTRKGPVYVRINPLDTPDALPDLAAVVAGAPDGIMLPKSRSAEDVRRLDHYLTALEVREGLEPGRIRILPIATEVAAALFTLGTYQGCSPRLSGLTWGAEDLAADLGASTNRLSDGAYADAFRLARATTLLGASAAGVMAVDTVFTDFHNPDGLNSECEAARKEGFQAKLAIHPNQLEIINRAFSVSPEEVAWARKVVRAFAENPQAGAIGLEGAMLDKPHLTQAQRLLQRAGEKA